MTHVNGMTRRRVLLVTDSFPPGSGGSGWSTFELARQLRQRGHHVTVVHAMPGKEDGLHQTSYDGIDVTQFRCHVPNVPVVRNVLKNERLWSTLARYLVTRLQASPVDVVHAQHVMTTVPAVRAGRQCNVPVVSTVRDYWPVCYWSDLIVEPSAPNLCPACTVGGMCRCIPSRSALGRAAWPLIPYMRHNLATKRRELARAQVVVAVSTAIARDLRRRAPELAQTRIETIPNPVDMTTLEPNATPPEQASVLYAGKLAVNKGVQFLLPALDAANVDWPLVVIGDGPMRSQLEADATRRGRKTRWLGWRDRAEVLTAMRGATMLAFPSYGPESLSRVLIEASALGLPIAAMDTGGTGDIIQHDVTGLLASSPEAFARDLGRLAGDPDLRARLGAGAAAHARTHFEASQVAARIEAVYASVLTTGPDHA
ncbi:MAG: glycosyltransferase family 4 protein [Acidobacteria bacterium]|jgi:glycogen synthase|nr:glycosyltransferase family 4 protein [Acidobacteriota bacterium]